MRVKSVELINLKSYDHEIIELSKGINILIGDNNSGKSTVVNALMNLQYHTFNKSDIRSLSKYSKTYIEIEDITESDCLSFYNPSEHKKFEYKEKFTVAWGLSDGSQPEENLYFDSTLPIKRIEANRIRLDTEKELKDVPFKQFRRFSDKENENNFIYPFLARRKSHSYQTNPSKEETFKVSASLSNLAAKIQKIGNPTHPQHNRFLDLCNEILGFTVGVIPVEQNSGIEPGIYVSESASIPLRGMGEGVANIVGFLVTLLTENNKLYLIEELENDVHPKALKKLLLLIVEKAENNQFVVSTHSHIVLKYLGVASNSKILYTSWTLSNSNGLKIPTSSIETIENTPQRKIEVLEKLGYDIFDFELFNSYLILEESSAERIIKDFLIPNFVPGLYNNIKTIAANGADDLAVRVIDFHRLFVFIHTSPLYYKRAWIIADGDEKGKEIIQKLKGKFPRWPKKHFLTFKKANFEQYYPQRFQKEVDHVLSMPHGKKKQDEKKELVDKVMKWAFKNHTIAMTEFKESFSEIIKQLETINKSVKK